MVMFTNGFSTLQMPENFKAINTKDEFTELYLVNTNISMSIKFSTIPTLMGLVDITQSIEENLKNNEKVHLLQADFITINDNIYYRVVSYFKENDRQVRRNEWPRKPFSWGTVEQAVHSHPAGGGAIVSWEKSLKQWRKTPLLLFSSERMGCRKIFQGGHPHDQLSQLARRRPVGAAAPGAHVRRRALLHRPLRIFPVPAFRLDLAAHRGQPVPQGRAGQRRRPPGR